LNKDLTVHEYLNFCSQNLHKDEYLKYEKLRKGAAWADIISKQSFTCYYCETDIRSIQTLILKGFIGLRKRGKYGFSGMHLELDHKNANKEDNSLQNLVASCYYCNNDKSNTFSDDIFKKYFGTMRYHAFEKLIKENNIHMNDDFRHHKHR
jgi:hypothetical protein